MLWEGAAGGGCDEAGRPAGQLQQKSPVLLWLLEWQNGGLAFSTMEGMLPANQSITSMELCQHDGCFRSKTVSSFLHMHLLCVMLAC